MSFNNPINTGGPRIDPIIQQIADAVPPGAKQGPSAPLAQLLPYDGMNVRTSADTSMPPQSNKLSLLSGESSKVANDVANQGFKASSSAGDDSMRNMVEMNNQNMMMTMLQGQLSMHMKFSEAIAKTAKAGATAVSQLAG